MLAVMIPAKVGSRLKSFLVIRIDGYLDIYHHPLNTLVTTEKLIFVEKKDLNGCVVEQTSKRN